MYTLALREYIRLLMKENLNEVRLREADITGDKKAPWGSDEHISDLENRIADLSHWRDKQKRGSESRANYSRLISRLKAELSSARKQNTKRKKISTHF
jgi:hypothetical protein